jgi:hypothetical protein
MCIHAHTFVVHFKVGCRTTDDDHRYNTEVASNAAAASNLQHSPRRITRPVWVVAAREAAAVVRVIRVVRAALPRVARRTPGAINYVHVIVPTVIVVVMAVIVMVMTVMVWAG